MLLKGNEIKYRKRIRQRGDNTDSSFSFCTMVYWKTRERVYSLIRYPYVKRKRANMYGNHTKGRAAENSVSGV